MNKSELVSAVAFNAGLTKVQAEKALNAVLDTLTTELQMGSNVALVGFGTFSVKDHAAKKGRNPKTGEAIDVPAKKAPFFKAGKVLKDAVK